MNRLARVILVTVLTGAYCALPLAASAQSNDINSWGQVGNSAGGTNNNGNVPTQVSGLSTIVAIQASNSDGYALNTSGTEFAWGYGKQGELGDGHAGSNSFNTPVTVTFPTGTVITAMGDADDDGFAVDSNGNGWSWGRNQDGELCTGSTSQTNTPTQVTLPTAATAVAGGANHVMWLTTAGTVYTCGVGSDGQLGNGTFGSSTTPVAVTGLPSGDPVVAISAGDLTDAALTQSGELWMWGSGDHGALGDGSNANSDVPVQVPGTWAKVYDGGSTAANPHALGITTAGAVEAWGANGSGQLGNGGTADSNTPVAVSVPSGVTFTSVMAAGFDSGAIDSSGNVWMWGRDQNGELGNGPGSMRQLLPVEVDSGRSMLSGTASNSIDG